MPKVNINDVIFDCDKNLDTALDTNNVINNTDGTISVFIPNGDGTVNPFPLSKVCCQVLANLTGQPYFYDLDEQVCRWSQQPQGCVAENNPIKIVLNSTGNDGSIFEINDDENCSLNIEFDYLIKLDCEVLSETIMSSSKTSNTTENQTLVELKNTFDEQTIICEELTSQIDALSQELINLNYSITCDNFPYIDKGNPLIETEPIQSVPILSETQKAPFGKTGFGDLAPMSFALMTRSVTFCLTEPNGLDAWKKILGINSFEKFLNGDIDSYTTKQVIELYDQNLISIQNNKIELMFECDTPFGYKTKVKNSIAELIKQKQECNNKLAQISDEIITITEGEIVSGCGSIIDYFENFSASVCVDLVNDDNTLTTIYETTLFPNIGSGNFYNYLVSHPNNSGFFVCGQPNITETWASGCTSITYPELNQNINTEDAQQPNNVTSCLSVKDMILDSLFQEYQSLDVDTFYQTLSSNILSSDWLSFSTTISDDNFISQISDKKIKLSIKVNNNCGNFCVLIDNIVLDRNCEDVEFTSILVNQSPGFNLTKIVDNKKSWLNNTDLVNREFDIKNIFDTNPIRQTDYDVNDERLIINTKEIDLNMNMATAVEYDVWCYMQQNPCLLTGNTCDSSSTIEPTDIYGTPIILPTATTTNISASTIYNLANLFLFDCLSLNSGSQANVCFPTEECLDCGKALKILISKGEQELWVTCEPSGNLGFYYITANTNTQGSILNITPTFSGGTSGLTTYINTVNAFIENISPSSQPIENFWSDSSQTCRTCCKKYGDDNINFAEFLTDDISTVTTVENFETLMLSDFIDVKSRKILSSYPTLKAIYDRYLTSNLYCDSLSSRFDYYKMDEFVGLINGYWDDLIEQVIPATTLWGSIKVYTNTLFDQQKFKYKSYSALFCNDPLNFIGVPSPINGISGQCQDVEVITRNVENYSGVSGSTLRFNPNVQTLNKLCISQMNWGSEFVGNVSIMDGDSYTYYSDFCNDLQNCDKKAIWYNMQESPEYMMQLSCGIHPDPSAVTFTVESFSVNGNELVSVPYSATVSANSLTWISANNSIISGCTGGNPTGYTYTDFVDFLNVVFSASNVDYEARISLVERDLGSNSNNGFYIIYPTDDVFILNTDSTNNNFGFNLTYTNNSLTSNSIPGYYKMTTDVDYDCLNDIVNE